MKSRIEATVKRGGITEETKSQHKGFSEWKKPKVSKQDHQSIVQVCIIFIYIVTKLKNIMSSSKLTSLLYMCSCVLQILIDRRDKNAVDEDGRQLPALIYIAREKRPHHPHNFKAGAMNTLVYI